MTRWHDLQRGLEKDREDSRRSLPDVQKLLIHRLSEVARLGLCDRSVVGWFTTVSGKQAQLTVSHAAPVRVGKWPAIPFMNLEHIDDARLTVSVTFDRKGLKEYSIQLLGIRRIASSSPWYARVDLDERVKGVGFCCHAMLHTHVGMTPDSDHEPSNDPSGERKRFSTRVPTPWLDPIDALNWLLATVDRRLEPAPVT